MTLGPLMVDIAGLALDAEDREVLQHPRVGGVILFTRNYESPAQLTELCAAIHALRKPPLLIAVDQEGGRVQRFRRDFTILPPARGYGRLFDHDHSHGLSVAGEAGWLMAAELLACGVDLSFAPVLDLDYGVSQVIGDRAFHRHVDAATQLARAFMRGMQRAGMAATGKHFPGHGAIEADSHTDLPVDTRPLEDIQARDLQVFRRLVEADLPAMMMAHVVYPDFDSLPASFSRRWIGDWLRRRLRFEGAVFCDDLSMEGAAGLGGYADRAAAALEAGCDMLPVCNNRNGVIEILDRLRVEEDPVSHLRLARLHGRSAVGERKALPTSAAWQAAAEALARAFPEQELGLER